MTSSSLIDVPFRPPLDNVITFELEGEPMGKQRHRTNRKTGHTYTPAKTKAYETSLRWLATAAMQRREPMEGAVRVDIQALFHVPQSWSRSKREAAMAGKLYHTSKPDGDNILKICCDAMRGIVFRDDAQAAVQMVTKQYSFRPRVVVTVRAL